MPSVTIRSLNCFVYRVKRANLFLTYLLLNRDINSYIHKSKNKGVYLEVVKYFKKSNVPRNRPDNREQLKREEEIQRREIATCSHSLSAVKCYYKRRDLYEHCGSSQKAHIDGSSARILSNDFTFTPWLSTLATF